MPALLELHEVDARYGPVRALDGVSISVEEGEVAALLRANGALEGTSDELRENESVRKSYLGY